jgi:hypothetical protein
VITAERNDPCRYSVLKRKDRVDTSFSVGPAIDVVAQEHNDVALDGIRKKLIQQIGQRRQVSVTSPIAIVAISRDRRVIGPPPSGARP